MLKDSEMRPGKTIATIMVNCIVAGVCAGLFFTILLSALVMFLSTLS